MAASDPAADAGGAAKPFELRVLSYFPAVKDFVRDANGNPIWGSLRGPEKIEARQQFAREQMVAAAEMRILQDQINWCYHREGVNHYEACKSLVEAYKAKLDAPFKGMLKGPAWE